MTITVPRCPLCASEHSQIFDRRTFRAQPVTNRICVACGLVYQSPRMSDEELEKFYAAEYRRLYQGSPGPNQKDLRVQRQRAASLLALAAPHIQDIQRHLDIGCSAGLLLQEFQTAYYCQPVGVEPGDAYRAYAQSQGLTVYASLDELNTKDNGRFDLVSMAHVLEHIAQPVDYLRALRARFLSPNGWLLVEVPNLYAHDCFETAHLVSYSPHTLQQALEQAGYRIIKLAQHGQPRSEVLPLYLTACAQPGAQPAPARIKPERAVKLKRQLGLLCRRVLTRLQPQRAWITPSENSNS